MGTEAIDFGKAMKPCACGGRYPKDLQMSHYTMPGITGFRGECFSCCSHMMDEELSNNPEDAMMKWNNELRFRKAK